MEYEEKVFNFLGITKWHEMGYKGKGIMIVSDEMVNDRRHGDVISPKGYYRKNEGHGDDVMTHIKLVAPEATLVAYPFSGKFDTTSYDCPSAEYIKENKAHIFTTSNIGLYPNAGKQMAIQDCIKAGCIFFAAAGNSDFDGLKDEPKYDGYWAIGGVKPKFTGRYDKDGTIYDWNNLSRASYSSVGKELDYVTIAEIRNKAGTSFCSPIFASMCGLVQQFFIEKIGRRLTRPEMETFINDNLVDTNTEGFDVETGFGLFVLPDPSTIKISHYITDTNVGDVDYTGFPEVRSDVVMRGIDKLHPELQKATNEFLEECKVRGLNVLVTETLRTKSEQEALYAQGRTIAGKIVTNARGYESPHCWGVAFDFCRNEKGREYDNSDGFFEKVGQIAKTIFDNTEYDLFWGGDFKTFVDKPHIEMIKYLPSNSTKWLIDTYGTPKKFMETWKEEEEMIRYKTVEEMPEYYRKDIQELINNGIIAGRGGEAGLDLSDDMCRMAIYAKKIFERGNK